MPKTKRKSTRNSTSPYARDDHSQQESVMELLSKINQRLDILEKKTELENKILEDGDDGVEIGDTDPEVFLRCVTSDVGKRGCENPMVTEHCSKVSGEVAETKSCFTSGGRKISSLISAKLKNKIWENAFIQMKELLKGYEDSCNYSIELGNVSEEGTSFRIINKGQNNPSKSLPVHAWAKAFNRYTAIMSIQFPNCSIGMNQHMETVLTIAEQNGNWEFYDVEFRQMIMRGEAEWGSTNLELYLFALMRNTSKNQVVSTSSLQIPKGACHKYHTTGFCSRGVHCQFQHKCTGCLDNHPRYRCPSPGNKQIVLPKFVRPFRPGASKEEGFKPNTNTKTNTIANSSKSNKA